MFTGKLEDIIPFDDKEQQEYLESLKNSLIEGENHPYTNLEIVLLKTIERLIAEKEIYRKHWLDLCDKIIAEIDKDGWCRLSMTKDEAFKMKKIFEGLD